MMTWSQVGEPLSRDDVQGGHSVRTSPSQLGASAVELGTAVALPLDELKPSD